MSSSIISGSSAMTILSTIGFASYDYSACLFSGTLNLHSSELSSSTRIVPSSFFMTGTLCGGSSWTSSCFSLSSGSLSKLSNSLGSDYGAIWFYCTANFSSSESRSFTSTQYCAILDVVLCSSLSLSAVTSATFLTNSPTAARP